MRTMRTMRNARVMAFAAACVRVAPRAPMPSSDVRRRRQRLGRHARMRLICVGSGRCADRIAQAHRAQRGQESRRAQLTRKLGQLTRGARSSRFVEKSIGNYSNLSSASARTSRTRSSWDLTAHSSASETTASNSSHSARVTNDLDGPRPNPWHNTRQRCR